MPSAVTVIIPTYNRAALLPKAIESVLNQSYAPFELIVVDDGSEDDTETLVAGYGRAVRYIRQPNRGPAAARNQGIRAASHELLAFLDSDDWFDPAKLEVQVAAMQACPGIGVSHTDELWFRRGTLLNQKKKHQRTGGDLFERCLRLCVVGMSTVMVRRPIFERHGLFDEDLPCCEDYEYWLRISVIQPFLHVNQVLTYKNGGRPDQVSWQYRMGMDKYRIRAIRKLLASGRLKPTQARQAEVELARKCRIYGNGCIKHGRIDEGRSYLDLSSSIIDLAGEQAMTVTALPRP